MTKQSIAHPAYAFQSEMLGQAASPCRTIPLAALAESRVAAADSALDGVDEIGSAGRTRIYRRKQ
jgi:hypothetical protein